MANLAHVRCLAHPAREAACRCPGCAQFFCRECVIEHDGRFICSVCLQRDPLSGHAPPRRGRPLASLFVPPVALAAIAFAWLFFYLFGQLLLSLFPPGRMN